MSIENLLDHKCDIFHSIKNTATSSYGLPGEVTFEYPETPDIENIPCHFSVQTNNEGVSQTDPKNILISSPMLTLPIGTDIRINDKVIDKGSGLEYTAGVPRNIRNHHIKVQLYRTSVQEAL